MDRTDFESIFEKVDCINRFCKELGMQVFGDEETIHQALDDEIIYLLEKYEDEYGCQPDWY